MIVEKKILKRVMKCNSIFILISLKLTIIFLLCFYILGFFCHGFYVETLNIEKIQEKDYTGMVNLKDKEFVGEFKPTKKFFAGFQIILFDLIEQDNGYLEIEISDNASNKIINQEKIDLSKFKNQEWYQLHIDRNLNENKIYKLKIRVRNSIGSPFLRTVEHSYLGEENISGDALLGYAYSKATFSLTEKVVISFLGCILYLIIFEYILKKNVQRERMKKYITLSTLFLLLFTNYTLNFIDNENKMFDEFQSDSESLVTGAIVADQKGIGINKWGMGRYMDVSGIFNHYPTEKNIDENWYKGYSLTEPSILLSNNVYTVEVAKIGNNIKFNNGALFNIDNVIYDEDKLIIKLSNDEPLNYEKYGSIDKISFFSKSMDMLESGKVFPYISNYGLQGWGFRFLAKMIAYQNVVEKFQIICSFLLSIVLLGIVVVIYKKYDILMSISFYITFLLSPWIINFARNLYWLEFTFFLPMLIGLFLSMNYQQKKYRILSYIFIFLSILFKSLCGYEYISSIMLGGIAFLITDFIIIFKEKEVLKARLLLMTIVIFGLFSLGGFICAISIHAYIRGDGNIFHGVESIFAQDMLRRLGGADLNEVAPVYWESLNASIWETLKLYFVFNTSIITGITGNFFVLLCLLSMVILVYNKLEKNLEDNKDFILYIVLFVTSISWFILAKAHSYIHLGMNYILWYFGYIQMCIYVICKEFFILVIDRINRRKII